MSRRLKSAGWIFVSLLLLGHWVEAGSLIILETGKDRTVLEASARQAENSGGVAPRIVKSGSEYRLIVGPLPSNEKTAVLYYRLKKHFPSAVVFETEKKVPPKLYRNDQRSTWLTLPDAEGSAQEYRLWIALFALAVTGVLALFVSSRKMQQLDRQHEKILKRHEEIERRFNDLFQRLGENIYRLSNDVIRFTSHMAEEVHDRAIGEKLRRVVSTENKIIDTTTNLLDFLRLRAKKVVIRNEPFDLNNMLEDVEESLVEKKEHFAEIETELIFEVGRDVPKSLVGDFLHIGEVVSNLLENAIEQAGGTDVRLNVNFYRSFTSKGELQFEITYFPSENTENIEEYFVPYYDEARGEYRRLGCFVAHELIQMMGGRVTAARNPHLNQVVVDVTIPVGVSKNEERRKYRLNRKEYTQKRVLVVNRSYDASLAVKELFAYFRHQVDILDAEQFENRHPELESYDILVIDEALVDPGLSETLQRVRQEGSLKVVGLRNLFEEDGAPCAGFYDLCETKPLNFKRVLTLINTLFDQDVDQEGGSPQEGAGDASTREFWKEIPESSHISPERFRDFRGATILVVEDNEVNLKMLYRVLAASGIRLLSARNGEEALRLLQDPEHDGIGLILMDINMPVMDGLEATKEIRKLPGYENLPIIALSGLNLETDLKRMQEAGMDGYLPKPLDIGALYTVFGRYLPRSVEEDSKEKETPLREPEGIEIEEALRRTHGNEMLLREILHEFLEGYGHSDKELSQCYEKGDYAALKQWTLDLLGLTGTIGATELHRILQELYNLQLQERWELIPNYLIEYGAVLDRVRRSLEAYFDEP